MEQKHALIELQNVHKVYGSGSVALHALRGINLTIQQGDFVAVMGPSGSGKSTCLNILGCLDVPTDGVYKFQGVEVNK
ncbi:MAG TPA: ATP-binding cassette domain-containing protein, partial [Planctomycetota bacterium]|nr:ATP-binding cassette domain-containing protein [Planctomycetota bacterium]